MLPALQLPGNRLAYNGRDASERTDGRNTNLWNLDDSNMHTTVPSVNNAAPPPLAAPGDGRGVLEGIVSEVHLDGSQPVRWWLRSDSNGESSLLALRD